MHNTSIGLLLSTSVWVLLNVERLNQRLHVPVHVRCGERRSPKVRRSLSLYWQYQTLSIVIKYFQYVKYKNKISLGIFYLRGFIEETEISWYVVVILKGRHCHLIY